VRWLAWVHPALMTGLLALAVLVLREGLRIRRGRIAGRPVDSRRHRRLGRIAVPLLLLGFGAGLASMHWLRPDWALASSAHFALALPAALGCAAGAALGLRLERGGGATTRRLHAWLGAAGLLFGLAAAVAGLSILP
jgi:hypothetical protein